MRFLTFATAVLAAMPLGLADEKPGKHGGKKDIEIPVIGPKPIGPKPTIRPGNPDPIKHIKSPGHIKPKKEKKPKEKRPKKERKPKKHGKNKHKNRPDPILTEEIICDYFNVFADDADAIYDLVKPLECGNDNPHSWIPVREALYDLEFKLDAFDKLIDQSDLNKCFECHDESKIACCYRRYADSLSSTLELIAEKIEYLDGETAYYIVTAVNSLREADYTFIYELVRRLQCDEHIREIMETQGATDGSTPGSIRARFALFVSTPYITGEEFKVDPGRRPEKPKPGDIKIIDKVKHKNKGKGGKERGCLGPRKHKGKGKGLGKNLVKDLANGKVPVKGKPKKIGKKIIDKVRKIDFPGI